MLLILIFDDADWFVYHTSFKASVSRCYSDTAGVFGEVVNAEHQLHWITENVRLLRQCGAFDPVYTLLRSCCRWMENDEYGLRQTSLTARQELSDLKTRTVLEIKCATTILYLMLVIESDHSFREEICMLP